MKNNRREFLKKSGLAGLSLAGGWLSSAPSDASEPRTSTHKATEDALARKRRQRFNMHGYAAPPLERVRIGLIGAGNRGTGALRRLIRIEGAEVRAVCDLNPERTERARQLLEEAGHHPELYSGGEEEWKRLCEQEDIDLVYICTPWHLHTPQGVYAMEHGKHAASEIPAALTLEECWQLVETSERTRQHFMMLENVCYDFFEMVTLNMAREGFLGEIIHGEGAYIHQLLGSYFSGRRGPDQWRLHQNIGRDGNLYAQHGLGPIAQVMDLNYGDQMDYLVSMSSGDFSMGARARELAEEDSFWEPFVGRDYRGNMNTSIIRTHRGRTIMLQHDTSSPRPYSRIHLVSGTEGIARKWPEPARIATSHDGWLPEEEFRELEERFTPEITRRVGDLARQVGGHGGMDTIMDWRLIDCLRNGLPLDMDVYDAALWSAVGPLSEWSVANRFNSVRVPDFTDGAWRSNQRGMDINLERGGTTAII